MFFPVCLIYLYIYVYTLARVYTYYILWSHDVKERLFYRCHWLKMAWRAVVSLGNLKTFLSTTIQTDTHWTAL